MFLPPPSPSSRLERGGFQPKLVRLQLLLPRVGPKRRRAQADRSHVPRIPYEPHHSFSSLLLSPPLSFLSFSSFSAADFLLHPIHLSPTPSLSLSASLIYSFLIQLKHFPFQNSSATRSSKSLQASKTLLSLCRFSLFFAYPNMSVSFHPPSFHPLPPPPSFSSSVAACLLQDGQRREASKSCPTH